MQSLNCVYLIHIEIILTDRLFYSFLLVFQPKAQYMGQKLTRLVRASIPATTRRTRPVPPEITPVKKRTATTKANATLRTRSIFPKFFFMIMFFEVDINYMSNSIPLLLPLLRLFHLPPPWLSDGISCLSHRLPQKRRQYWYAYPHRFLYNPIYPEQVCP